MKTVEQIVEEIDEATEPSRMSQEEALKFLERISTELDCRIDGLRCDLGHNY